MPVIIDRVLRTGEGKILRQLKRIAVQVNSIEEDFAPLSDAELRALTPQFRERLANGEDIDALLPEAFAAVREASRRTTGLRHFDVQCLGGMVLHKGRVAEMKTGEGKTFVASLALYLNALPTAKTHDGREIGQGVHLVTVNDYLAQRDAEWNRGVFERLGMTVDSVSYTHLTLPTKA